MPSCSKTSHDHYYLHRSCVPDLCHKARWLSFGGVKFQQKSLWYATPQPYGHAPTYQISLTYLKRNNYLTLRSKVKVQQRSLLYATHHLMDMHPHTKYHWPISKETIIWPRGQRSRSNKGHYGMRHTALWSSTHIPNIIDLSRKKQLFDLEVKGQGPNKGHYGTRHTFYGHAPTYQISLTYLERNNYLTLRSKVKVQQRSLWYATHRLMVIHPHTKYHWPISKETIIWPWSLRSRSKQRSLWYATHLLWSCTHIPNIIDLSRKTKNVITRTRKYYLKNYYLTFRTKVIMVCDTPPYGHAPTYQISLTDLERNNYLTLRSKNKFPRSSLRYVTHRLMVIHPHTKYYWPISKEKNVMARTRKYHSKNIYLTFRSKVMVPRRSLWYATHRLVVMYPHIKYHWPIWKDKKVMVRTSFAEKQKKWKRKKKIRLKQYISPFVRRGDIIKNHI